METTKQGSDRLYRRKHGLGANAVEANEAQCQDKTSCLTGSDGTMQDRSCSEEDGGCFGRVVVQGKHSMQPDQGQTWKTAKIREKANGPDTKSLLHSLLKADSSVEENLTAQEPFIGSDFPQNRGQSLDKAASRTEKSGHASTMASTMASQTASRQRLGAGKSANSTADWAKNILSKFLWSAFRVRLSSCKGLPKMNAALGLSAALSDAVVVAVENGPAKTGDVEDGKRPSMPTWLKRQIETQRRAGIGERQTPVASVMDQALNTSNALLQLRYRCLKSECDPCLDVVTKIPSACSVLMSGFLQRIFLVFSTLRRVAQATRAYRWRNSQRR